MANNRQQTDMKLASIHESMYSSAAGSSFRPTNATEMSVDDDGDDGSSFSGSGASSQYASRMRGDSQASADGAAGGVQEKSARGEAYAQSGAYEEGQNRQGTMASMVRAQ